MPVPVRRIQASRFVSRRLGSPLNYSRSFLAHSEVIAQKFWVSRH